VNHQFGSTAEGKDCFSGPHLTNMSGGSIGGCIVSQKSEIKMGSSNLAWSVDRQKTGFWSWPDMNRETHFTDSYITCVEANRRTMSGHTG